MYLQYAAIRIVKDTELGNFRVYYFWLMVLPFLSSIKQEVNNLEMTSIQYDNISLQLIVSLECVFKQRLNFNGQLFAYIDQNKFNN